MPKYKWTGDGTFRDHRNNRVVKDGDVVEVDESVAKGHEAFVRANSDEPEDGGGESDADAGTYTADELAEKEHNELRSIASEYDDVDGRAGTDALVEALAGRERIDIEG